MKIFLPFSVQDIGGTSSFAKKFQAGMKQAGHEVFFEFQEDYDLLFLIVQCPLKYLRHAKSRGRKIVQRLDGTYYWTTSGWHFPLYNAKAALIRRWYTDFTIYQSTYSKEAAQRFLGQKKPDPSTTIYNGVDLTTFSPSGPVNNLRANPQQKIFFTASAFRRADQIQPLIAAAEAYRKKYDDNFQLVIAGSFGGRVSETEKDLKKIPYVRLLGKVKNDGLAAYERGADAFVFTHLNPPCPNNIIEALACGLPVCGLNDGAMTEIVNQDKSGKLLGVQGTGFWRQRDFDTESFADNMAFVAKNRQKLGVGARQVAVERFGLEQMIEGYGKAFRSLLK